MSHSHHEHHHGHGHSHTHGHPTRQLWWLSLLTVSYLIAEIVGGLTSGSLALLADAGHMAIDVASIALSIFAVWVAKRPATSAKTFGYYRAEILAALVNGALLFGVALGIFYEALERFSHPEPIRVGIMAAVSAGGVAVNLIGLVLVRRNCKDNLNLRGVWLHVATDALGSAASLLASGLIFAFGWTIADPLLSILLAGFILFGAYHLLYDCVNVLLEGVPKGMDVAAIRKRIEAYPSVQRVHDLHVWAVTSGVHSLSAHVLISDGVDYCEILAGIIQLLEKEFSIEHVTLQLEPPGFVHAKDLHLHA